MIFSLRKWFEPSYFDFSQFSQIAFKIWLKYENRVFDARYLGSRASFLNSVKSDSFLSLSPIIYAQTGKLTKKPCTPLPHPLTLMSGTVPGQLRVLDPKKLCPLPSCNVAKLVLRSVLRVFVWKTAGKWRKNWLFLILKKSYNISPVYSSLPIFGQVIGRNKTKKSVGNWSLIFFYVFRIFQDFLSQNSENSQNWVFLVC